jgi:hypothetical protein
MASNNKITSRFVSNDSWAMELNDIEIQRADDGLQPAISEPNLVIRIKTTSRRRKDRIQKKIRRARQKKREVAFGGNSCVHPLM